MGYRSELALELESSRVEEFINAVEPHPYFDIQGANRFDSKEGVTLFHWECVKNYEFDAVIKILNDRKIKFYALSIGEDITDIEEFGNYNIDVFGVTCSRCIRFDEDS